MAAPTHNLVVKTGQYTANDGQQKNRWQKVGTVFRHDDGGTSSIKIECMPVGVPEWDGWVSVFPIEQNSNPGNNAGNGYQRTNAQPQRRSQPVQGGRVDFDDDIPF